MLLSLCKANSDHAEGLDYLFAQAKEIACKLPQGLPFIEIGTRAGGSALLFLQAIKESGIPRPLITVDPFGCLYRSGPEEYLDPAPPGTTNIPWYPPTGEDKYRKAMAMLSSFSNEFGLTHIHYRFHSRNWMCLWEFPGCWIEGEQINEKPFAFVYLDGEHVEETVEQELSWFIPKMATGGIIVIDDVQHIRKSRYPLIRKTFEEGEEDNLRLYFSSEGKCSTNSPPKCDGKKIGTVYLHHHKEIIEI